MISRSLLRFSGVLVVVLFGVSLSLHGQINPTTSLSGTVVDPGGSVVPGAEIQVTDLGTAAVYRTTSGSDGTFLIGNLLPGEYSVAVKASGFQSAEYKRVQLVVGKTYDLKVALKIGEVNQTVTVEAGQQVLETSQTEIGTTISGSVITHAPSASNTALWGVTMMSPDIQTIGGPRQSSADGLPGGAVNVTYDGIAAQWQYGKHGDPLFTMIYPSIDDVSEVNISTVAARSSNTGEGAVQINMVSQRGTNQWHGGAWEYFRNDALNSNYYFNNLNGQPRPKVRNNQWGVKLGGPLVKNKLFFFGDLGYWIRPLGVARTRSFLNSQASGGVFTFTPVDANGNNCTPGAGGCVPVGPQPNAAWQTCGSSTCSANLLQLVQNFGGTGTVDPLIAKTLATLNSAASAPGVTAAAPRDPLYQQAISFSNHGPYTLTMPDLRLDYNVSQNHSLEFDYHLTRFILSPDILNGQDHTYPVAPFNTNAGGYTADRSIFALAWRWNLAPTVSNEVRFGFQTSPEWFAGDLNPTVYPLAKTNLSSAVRIQPVLPGALQMDNPWLINAPGNDNSAVIQLSDNLSWARGSHNMAFGFTDTRAGFKSKNFNTQYATVNLGLAPNDPLFGDFSQTTLPGTSATSLTIAQQLYGLLAGRVTNYAGSVAFDPSQNQFASGIPSQSKFHQSDFGVYGSDSWRIRPTLTFNYGLRWQYEGTPVDELNEYFMPQGGISGLYGVSGTGNLFKPGTLTGTSPTFISDKGKTWYNNWYKGFAPSIGVAWQPSFENAALKTIFGDKGQSVLRGGYSIAYSREGLFNWAVGIAQSNPGYSGTQTAAAANQFPAGSVQINNLNIPGVIQNPTSFVNSIPINPSAGNSANVVDPSLHMPYVQSWSLGVQRSLTPNTVLEVRYVGNHAVGLWGNINYNEVNIFENGFLAEFKNAAKNLAVCQAANPSCSSFANQGLPGQTALPILSTAFAGLPPDSGFANGGFISNLQSGQAGSFANTLASSLTYLCNLTGTSVWPGGTCPNGPSTGNYPKNFFVVNPDAPGGANLLKNAFQSTYNGLVLDLRNRTSHGLTLDGSYTFAKALSDDWQRNLTSTSEAFTTLRNWGSMKGPSPYDLRHAVKVFTSYELPFGPGHAWSSSHSALNNLIGGWQLSGTNRWQSGRASILFGGLGGTVNQNDGGIILNGMSLSQLQSQLGIRKTPTPAPGAVFYFPQSLLGPNGVGVNPQVLQGCNTPGAFCQRAFIYGPSFFRSDLSIQKTTKITERVKTELRFEFLNAFNNANFLWGDAYNTSGSSAGASFFSTVSGNLQNPGFGRIFTAYQDLDSTADPGGRTIQAVFRINF